MKRNTLLAMAAGGMLLFASCGKQGEGDFYRIDGDHITFTMAMDSPQSDDKQAYLPYYQSVLFCPGDSILINGTPYALIPEGTNYTSTQARATAALSADGSYRFAYPANRLLAGTGSAQGRYLGQFPSKVVALNPYDITYLEYLDDSIYAEPFMPMYFATNDIAQESGVVLKNAYALLTPRVNYGTQFADTLFSYYTGETYGEDNPAPEMTVVEGLIQIAEGTLSGLALLNLSDPSNPTMTTSSMTSNGDSCAVVFKCRTPMTASHNIGYSQLFPVTNDIATIPVPPVQNPDGNRIAVCLKINTVLDSTPYYLVYLGVSKRFTADIERNHIYTLPLNMSTFTQHRAQHLSLSGIPFDQWVFDVQTDNGEDCKYIIFITPNEVFRDAVFNNAAGGNSKSAAGISLPFDNIAIK